MILPKKYASDQYVVMDTYMHTWGSYSNMYEAMYACERCTHMALFVCRIVQDRNGQCVYTRRYWNTLALTKYKTMEDMLCDHVVTSQLFEDL